MSQQNKTSNLIISTVILMLITLVSQVNIVASLAGIFIIPAVVAFVFCNYGILKSVFSTMAVLVFCAINICIGYIDAFPILIVFAFVSVILGYVIGISFSKGYNFSYTLTVSVAIDFIILIIAVAYCRCILKLDITQEIQNTVSENFFANFDVIKSLLSQTDIHIDEYEEQLFNTLYITLPGLLPFVSFLVSIFVFMIRYFVSKALCRKYLITAEKFTVGFDIFSPGRGTLIFLGVCALGITLSTTNKWMMIFFCSALCVLTLYMLSAFAVIDFKLKEFVSSTAKRVIIMVLICFVLVILSTVLPVLNPFYILAFLGLTDTIFDYRKIRSKKR